MSKSKHVTVKTKEVAALQAKLAEYAATIEQQRARLVEMSERLTQRDRDCSDQQARIEWFVGKHQTIRTCCVKAGVFDAHAMSTIRAVERLAARVGNYQRMQRELSNAQMHRRMMAQVLASNGYVIEYRNNGCVLDIQRTQSAVKWWRGLIEYLCYGPCKS